VYPGPIGAILTPQLEGIEHAASLPFASSLCGACYEVCPVKIDIPRILLHLREKAVEAKASRGERTVMRLAAWTLTGAGRFAFAERIAGALGRGRPIRRLPPPLSGWTETRDLKPPARQSFRSWWSNR
jgi:L-lactate dehydrogenase complex protein LldF